MPNILDYCASMAFLELYPIVVAAVLWGTQWPGKKILFYCDNITTVQIIKNGRSKEPFIMKLMRRLTMYINFTLIGSVGMSPLHWILIAAPSLRSELCSKYECNVCFQISTRFVLNDTLFVFPSHCLWIWGGGGVSSSLRLLLTVSSIMLSISVPIKQSFSFD